MRASSPSTSRFVSGSIPRRAGYIERVAGPCGETPWPRRLDRVGRVQSGDVTGGLLRKYWSYGENGGNP